MGKNESIIIVEDAKRNAALRAVSYVKNNLIVGLGTGSTTNFAIDFIGEKMKHGLKINAVPTSEKTQVRAMKLGIPLLENFEKIDVTVDGADEVDRHGNLIKGGGGALTREKIVAAATRKEIIIVDESKLVNKLGRFPLPVEVLPFGWKFVQKAIEGLGCSIQLRRQGKQIYVTNNGNYILDCQFGEINDPENLSGEINTIPGVVENGLFCGLTDLVIVGSSGGETRDIQF